MKVLIFKGKITAVFEKVRELAKEYEGWTVEEYIRLARVKKRAYEHTQTKKF